MLDQQLSVVFDDLTTVRIHGEGPVADDVRAFGMNKETGGIARRFVLGVVQSADGLPLMRTVRAGNLAEANARKLRFILAVPARCYAELSGTLEGMDFRHGLATAELTRYRNLAEIERAFWVPKSDLEIAALYHCLPDHICADALICFLALVLYRVMRARLEVHSGPASPNTALELLGRILQQRATIGEQVYTGISKTRNDNWISSPLWICQRPETCLSCHFCLPRTRQIKRLRV